ncbi:MAG: metal-dependent hydrolase [archaeon]
MPLAVTHVLSSIILVDLYRDYITRHRSYFTLHTVLVAGFAGLLPDIDIVLNWILGHLGSELVHGTYTHTFLFGLVFLIPAGIYRYKRKYKTAAYFLVTTFGVMLHVLLDVIIGGGYGEGAMLFWPISDHFFKVHISTFLGFARLSAGLDAVILLLWLYHEEVKHKITDFI